MAAVWCTHVTRRTRRSSAVNLNIKGVMSEIEPAAEVCAHASHPPESVARRGCCHCGMLCGSCVPKERLRWRRGRQVLATHVRDMRGYAVSSQGRVSDARIAKRLAEVMLLTQVAPGPTTRAELPRHERTTGWSATRDVFLAVWRCLKASSPPFPVRLPSGRRELAPRIGRALAVRTSKLLSACHCTP